MKGSFVKAASLLAPLFSAVTIAQGVQDTFTHPETGITFVRETLDSATTTGGLQWGYALPATGSGNAEYIGYFLGALKTGRQGWSGISHNAGMPNNLLLVAYPDGDNVKTTFAFAGGYVAPDAYTGNATASTIYQKVNDTNFELIYRCQWCWVWNQNGADGSQIPNDDNGVQIISWAQHSTVPTTPWVFHDNGQGIFALPITAARNANYDKWAALASGGSTPAPSGTPVASASATPSPTQPVTCATPAPTDAYDYIVVGGGAGGIPVADRLSEKGKKVLLLEKGPPSLGRFGGTMKPDWLQGTNLTRFDVPGLCNQIWRDSAGIACTDTDQMAGCVLGGGSAINAALWWNPVSVDWDYNFPSGWKSTDIASSQAAVFARIPGTDTPSMDGQRYKQEGYGVLSSALKLAGWNEITPNNEPNRKSRVFGHTPFMYSNAQRQGPLGTYLVSAVARKNFKLLTNTSARRIVRSGGVASGVELENGCGTVQLATGGRVIVSAGTFGSPKLLYRSGIGPTAQLNTVKSSAIDGATMINSTQWINLPVGQNLNDHVNTDLVIQHPNISFYDFYQAWSAPIAADKDAYLNKRSGILATSAPNIGPMAWDTVAGTDGITRQIQWTARVEGPVDNDTHSLTISQYLGRGTTSRGSISINGALNIVVSQAPYLRTAADTAAVIQGIKNMQAAIAKVPSITWEVPKANVSVEDYVASLPLTPSVRRANHWIGTNKIGNDSGLNGGTSVVDVNTQVYGTKNIHVVDASIFPGHITTNPTSYIVTVGEHAAKKILALGASTFTASK